MLWGAAVGSINNTFGIKGVQEHTMFFKNIDDANRLRRRMSDCFERASLPQTSEEVRGPHRENWGDGRENALNTEALKHSCNSVTGSASLQQPPCS